VTTGGTPAQFAKALREESAETSPIVREAGNKAD